MSPSPGSGIASACSRGGRRRSSSPPTPSSRGRSATSSGSACTDRHRHQEFQGFLKQVAAAYPRRQLHVVVDNLSTHKHPAVRAWLPRYPRITLHFTPTSGSWLNLVEAFFSIITRRALRRGNFPTVADLIAAWNDRCAPFTWTKDPDTVIAKATDPRHRKASTTSATEH